MVSVTFPVVLVCRFIHWDMFSIFDVNSFHLGVDYILFIKFLLGSKLTRGVILLEFSLCGSMHRWTDTFSNIDGVKICARMLLLIFGHHLYTSKVISYDSSIDTLLVNIL